MVHAFFNVKNRTDKDDTIYFIPKHNIYNGLDKYLRSIKKIFVGIIGTRDQDTNSSFCLQYFPKRSFLQPFYIETNSF